MRRRTSTTKRTTQHDSAWRAWRGAHACAGPAMWRGFCGRVAYHWYGAAPLRGGELAFPAQLFLCVFVCVLAGTSFGALYGRGAAGRLLCGSAAERLSAQRSSERMPASVPTQQSFFSAQSVVFIAPGPWERTRALQRSF